MGLAVRTAFVALVALLGAPALAGDIVVNPKGQTLGNNKSAVPPGADDYSKSEWEIVDYTIEGITYRIPGIPTMQSLPASSIRDVFFDPETTPQSLLLGRASGDRGDYAAAREQFARVQKDSEALPWAKNEAAFRSAESYLLEGKADEAEKQLAAFKDAFPKSKWVTVATDRRARALIALDKVEDAKAEFASLKKLPGVPEEIGVQADFYVLSIDEAVAVRRADTAALQNVSKAYDALISRIQGKSSFDQTAKLCRVGKANCLIFLGKPAEARDDMDKLVTKDTKDARVLAAAYNCLGVATWRAAPTDVAQQKAALFHFLRVVTLYGDESDAEDAIAEAMFHAGELFRELKAVNPEYNARARREWNEVRARFPGTTWARRAAEALGSR